MTTESAPRIKITYATLRADNEELHAQFEAGLATARTQLGGHHRNYVAGAWRDGDGTFEVRSPIDTEIVLGTFARGTAADVDEAVAAARAAQPAWAATPWRERVAIIKRAGDLISERLMDYSALMAIEVGKNRIEALGEVEESADLLRYYATTMDRQRRLRPPDGQPGRRGGPHPLHPAAARRLRGHQPVQLPDGARRRARPARRCWPATPSSSSRPRRRRCRRSSSSRRTSMPASRPAPSTWSWARARRSARRSRITRASTASCSPARTRSGCGCSTRSRRAGRGRASSRWAARTRPSCSRKADLEEAAEGIMRSAFGFGGQKCSANSRVYVERPVHDELVRLLVEKTEAITVGDPLLRANWMGPIIDQRAVDRHQAAVAEARRDGTVFVGGERLTDARTWSAASTSSRRSSATCRPRTASSATSCSRRSRRWRRSTRSTRRSPWPTTPSTG